jgi:hypothetical protein
MSKHALCDASLELAICTTYIHADGQPLAQIRCTDKIRHNSDTQTHEPGKDLHLAIMMRHASSNVPYDATFTFEKHDKQQTACAAHAMLRTSTPGRHSTQPDVENAEGGRAQARAHKLLSYSTC